MKEIHTLKRGIFNPFLFAALFFTVTLSSPVYSHGRATGPSATASAAIAEQKNRAEELNRQLVGLIAQYKSANATEKSSLAIQLAGLAEERRLILGKLIENDPGTVLSQALPDDVLDQMPANAQAFLEQWMELEGELQLLHVDYKDQSQSHYVYLLETDLGERFSLHFAKQPPGLLSGTRGRANGLLLQGFKARDAGETEGAVAVEDGDEDLQILEAGGSTTTTTTSSTTTSVLPNTFGAQKTLVLLVNFQDKPSEQPLTVAQAHDLVFNAASNFFQENSYGQTSLTGDVYGWYTVNFNSTYCPELSQMASTVETIATANGVNLSNYSRYVFLTPRNACAFDGTAYVGGNPSRAWINGKFDLHVTAHELGHNFGLMHSHAMDCGTTTLSTNCTSIEYGDSMDDMGNPDPGHYNAFQKSRLGWLDYNVSPSIVTVTASGTYTLGAYETSGTAPKALKILKSTDAVTGKKTWYFAEYRQAIGIDSFLSQRNTAERGDVTNGIIVHTGTDLNENSSYLLHMKPDSFFFQRYGYLDWFDPGLAVGDIFTDAESGVTFSPVSAGGGTVSVNVNFGTQSCVHANPAVTLSPSQSPAITAGQAFAFTATVTNNDGPACADAIFNLVGVVPAGWISSLASPSLTLASGASATTTITVTSPTTAAAGSYPVAVIANEQGNSAYSGSGGATYVVAAGNHPPAAVNDSGTTIQGTSVSINVIANDVDPDADPLTVVATQKPSNGSVAIGSAGILTYTPKGNFAGTDTFGYTINDGRGGTASATVTVTVNKSTGGRRK